MKRRARVAVIGGGCGAMTAAFELTRPEHEGRFEVSVFQQGWRLGGKGASGRGPAGRIEEHGLHVWLGFYENSFALMRQCYAELAADSRGSPFGDWREAFLPEPDIGLFAPREGGGWQQWSGRLPPRPGLPGDPLPPGELHSMAGYYAAMIDLLVALLVDLEVRQDGTTTDAPPWPPAMPSAPTGGGWAAADVATAATALLGRGMFLGAAALAQGLALVRHAVMLFASAGLPGPVAQLVEQLAGALRAFLEQRFLADDAQRHLWEIADLVMAAMVGGVRHNLLAEPRGLDVLDGFDCREWLMAHGASQRSVDSPFVRGLYDLALAYVDGDAARPAAAAGQGLRGLLRMFFGYRGAMFWRMRAGMGDVVFAPLHLCLERRGVDFHFFHRLVDVIPAADGTHVERLAFDVQARPRAGRAYRPTVEVAGRPCWPSAPDWNQLTGGRRLGSAGVDFESHWTRVRAGERVLEVGRDFDHVVLAVSVAALPDAAPALLARDARWRRMVETTGTVATQAFQIWLRQDLESLGWTSRAAIVSAFEKPFDSWCDMGHVVAEEGWGEPPATAVYFCGVLADPPTPPADDDIGYPARRAAEVRASAERFLDGPVQHLWPLSHGKDGFRRDLLVDAGGSDNRAAGLLDGQYWRANVSPTDRYVQTLPGSLEHRLSPLDAGYDNLTMAGDWTASGFSSGCTESAVMSGRLAAHALSGLPRLEDIAGYDHP